MTEPFSAVRVTDNVYWVGAIDWTLRDFHGYATERGTTYNAYLILADKITLIDTVKAPFYEEMLSRIASLVDPSKIDYIISNHSEMDHTGSLPRAIERIKPEKVFASANGVKALKAHFHFDAEVTPVADGQNLSLGNRTLMFVETKMLHWPDSMFTYLVDEDILFSQDGFGMHLASTPRFDDEINEETLYYEAAKYFANIVMPFAPMVAAALKKAASLKVSIIAPDHGPIWRKNPAKIVEWYNRWSEKKPTNKAVIVYDTMWESTDTMAKAIEDGLVSEGVEVKTMRLRLNERSSIATEVLEAGALLVGSPTLNNNMFPTVADILCYLRGLRPKNLVGTAFGSYGWGGGAVKQVREILDSMKVEMVAGPLEIEYVPDKDALVKCRELGQAVAHALKAKVG